MRLLQKLVILSLIPFVSSCAMLYNEKNVDVTINSSPSGADIFIAGVNYGQTPKTLNLEPKEYDVILNKEGYGTANLKLEHWTAIRSKKGEGGRCLADALGTMLVIPVYSFYFSGKCDEFKQSEYNVTIPRTQHSRNSTPTRNNHYPHYQGYPSSYYGYAQ